MADHKNKKTRIPKTSTKVKTGAEAAGELFIGLGEQSFAAVFFFTSGDYDLVELGRSLSTFYPDIPIYGCTSAGVIGVSGYEEDSVSAFALPASHFHVDADVIGDISTIDISAWGEATKNLVDRFESNVTGPLKDQTFGLVLIDGLSLAEETILSAVYPELGDIPLFGGSAGDDLKFKKTQIFFNSEAISNCAALILVHTTCPFQVFRTEHFVETDRKMVITEADPASRIVHEINASPATEEYARLIGVQPDELNSTLFAAHPVMVRVGGAYYVRSIQKPEGEDGLRFFCAIDEGLVLTLAKGQDIVTNLKHTLQDVDKAVGDPELIIGCDCIFRRLELEQTPEKYDQVSDILREHNVFGFNTYGEQFAGMHVNQTFTGVAIGWRDSDD
ncbi:FIST N-terminal domain-containing protein [Terasakiella sp. A23]|uniref:FIST N-terminal domain-containing protein n=1 Tax=Terasakiella sp. FCG-A23 TaxID=3080561 RepID=UPI0029545570|nr:FIST N-terminal domain-containing protein [Terasakiella sp. A23]MDV7339337.1 FIST N-terminal domain-containing protein [Terasakiella sp. A23]